MSIVTKVFIVLTLICSLTLAVFVVLTLNAQEKYRDALTNQQELKVAALAQVTKLESALDNAKADLDRLTNAQVDKNRNYEDMIRNLQNQIEDLNRQVATGKNELNTAEASVTALTTANQAMTDTLTHLNAELATLRHDVPLLTQQNAELNRRNNELQTGLEAAENTIRRLQEQIAELEQPQKTPSTGAEGGPGGGTVTTLVAVAPINGKVTRVDSLDGRTYVTLSLGKRDGVQENFRFTLYRDSTYVGDAVVRRVTPDQSVAEVTVLRTGEQVEASDLAISGPGR